MHCQAMSCGFGGGGEWFLSNLYHNNKQKVITRVKWGGNFFSKYSYFEKAYENDDIMVPWSVLFLPTTVCVVFISVIVTHPSFVHGGSIRAHEKWLMAVMSASPPSAYHTSSSTRNTNSPFIPLQCFLSASYTFLPSHFHGTNPPFSVEAGLILVQTRLGPGHRISYTGGGAVGVG